jgi:hypothetical protein
MCYAGEMLHRFPPIDIDKEVTELLAKNTSGKQETTSWLPKKQKDDFFGRKQQSNDKGLVKLWNEKIIVPLRNKVREQTGMI